MTLRAVAISKLQYLAQIVGADPQLLQPCQIVEHAPLLGDAAIGNPENRHLLYLDTPPRRLNAPERLGACRWKRSGLRPCRLNRKHRSLVHANRGTRF